MSALPIAPSATASVNGTPTTLAPVRRIGLLAHGFASWGGGIDFLHMIASSLHHADPKVELHVLAPMRGTLVAARSLRDAVRSLLGRSPMAAHHPHPDHLARALAGTGAVLHKIDIGPRALTRATARLRLDALLPAISPLPEANAPWVGYVFDFQHKHLPQFFTEQECALRDIDFRRMLDSAKVVIVNARDVVKDIEHYFPVRKARVFALPFSPSPGSDAFSVDVDEARLRYSITGPYFIVCNQFWKHKDHGTAFKAFAALARRHPELSLVCTGVTSDYRFPDYFDELMGEAARDGVADRIYALGMIPKLDQLALIRGAVALVQPTLFEGGPGGGAVYDAVALGQHAIVSDIPVNTEIDDPLVSFFRTGDPLSLATALSQAWTNHGNHARLPPPATLIARGIERRRACGEVLLQAISCVTAPPPAVATRASIDRVP
jgi:glycosyltransferase involved in cell wall biosynthesis